jgi:hypothetical protein
MSQTKPCCAHEAPSAPAHHTPVHAHHGHSHNGQGGGALSTSVQATLHCLTGCIIGEVAGLAIGVSLGLGTWPTIFLATILAYISGFTLGVVPVMRRMGKSFLDALKLIWIGEAVSIGVMEIAMNAADYSVGGMQAGSVFSHMFWIGILVAIPAGFLAAWPVNYWLLKRDLKKCH